MQDIRTYSPLVLAYIGDAIYDLVIRTLIVVSHGQLPAATSFTRVHQRSGKGFSSGGDD